MCNGGWCYAEQVQTIRVWCGTLLSLHQCCCCCCCWPSINYLHTFLIGNEFVNATLLPHTSLLLKLCSDVCSNSVTVSTAADLMVGVSSQGCNGWSNSYSTRSHESLELLELCTSRLVGAERYWCYDFCSVYRLYYSHRIHQYYSYLERCLENDVESVDRFHTSS
uniref:Uncharacterized protein n=1 Tax=Lygus hesperus TaxID=30085 RepID=A0A146LLH3_LYGHE